MRYIMILSSLMLALSACGGSGSSGGGSGDNGSVSGYGITEGDVFTNAQLSDGAVAFEEHWEDGTLKAKGFRNSAAAEAVLIGPYQSFYEDGSPASEGVFQAGAMHGAWHFWYENGVQRLEGIYIEGQLDESQFWIERDEAGNAVDGHIKAMRLAAAVPEL